MAILHTYNLNGAKDSFSDWISNISPEDTFIVTSSKKESTPQNKFKWQIDALDKNVYDLSVVRDILEGAAAPTPDPITIFGTKEKTGRTQIFRKTFGISDSALATSVHGRAGELKYQLEKAGKELKNIMEVVFSSKQVQADPSDTQAARTDGLFAQIAGKDVVNPDLPTAAQTGSAVHIAGAINMANFEKIMFALYKSGSKACTIVTNPNNAAAVAAASEAFGGVIRQLQTFNKTGVEQPYRPLGGLDEQYSITDSRGCGWCVCFSRFCPPDVVYFVHSEDLTQRVLREPKATQLGKTGSSETWQLVIEAGLCLSNPFAAGVLEVTAP